MKETQSLIFSLSIGINFSLVLLLNQKRILLLGLEQAVRADTMGIKIFPEVASMTHWLPTTSTACTLELIFVPPLWGKLREMGRIVENNSSNHRFGPFGFDTDFFCVLKPAPCQQHFCIAIQVCLPLGKACVYEACVRMNLYKSHLFYCLSWQCEKESFLPWG